MFRKIACAVSGGVDSSVAAYLLLKKGYEVTGVFMKNWDIRDDSGELCTVDRDFEDAQYVCRKLNIPLRVANFVKPYWHHVFCTMLQEYQDGLTPNPDILCNKKIKFDAFFDYAVNNLRVDAIATGHYARIRRHPHGDVALLRGVDLHKDQTFFLSQVNQAALRKVLFPVGEMTKAEVKALATSVGLEKIARKRESTGICFIGKRNFRSFIEKYVEPREGTFVDIDTGEVIGRHSGIHCWTRGQRCHVQGRKFPYFVVTACPETQKILVAAGTNHPALYCQTFYTSAPHWIHHSLLNPGESFACLFKTQHPEEVSPCTVLQGCDERLCVSLPEPMRAITPGQFAVFYRGEECLGSAKIDKLGPTLYEELAPQKERGTTAVR